MSVDSPPKAAERLETRSYGDLATLPRELDLVIVGGGPAGTAAACRAKELGLSLLVIDYDDLMKRIRDYSKDKLILPSFGGGDRQRFPAGGELVTSLRFSPIDKDEMCSRWKSLYREHGLSARVGIELVGFERGDDGVLEVAAYDHARRADTTLRTKNLVLAIGRGVPRRFDIPGNLDGISYLLADPARFVGRPACVVGGGTSAAEAVIAISQAKFQAEDPSPICWSYRGDRMPRVSKALAESFFEAYVGNGNIRYYPRSEPAAVVVGDDRAEYLAVRIDRRCIEGRPHETTQLEFAKEQCIACIGEDLPAELLGSMGISMAEGGADGKRRMLTNRYLESVQPNVYLIGDLLSQAYFEADDFDQDPSTYRVVKHRGNVKSALRDGVLVAQVIAQRLAGVEPVDVTLEDGEPEEGPASLSAVTGSVDSDGLETPGEAERGAASSARRQARSRLPGAKHQAALLEILPAGISGEEWALAANGVTSIGRTDCSISFPQDTLLSTPHASIARTDEGWQLRDEGGRSGVFLRLPVARPWPMKPGDLIRVGRQFLRLDPSVEAPTLVHYDAKGGEVSRHPLSSEHTLVAGRRAEITLDENDRTLSRRHLAISVEEGTVRVKDLKSANGSYLRVEKAVTLEHGQQFRVGQQTLAVALGDAVVDLPSAPVSAALPTHEASSEMAAADAAATDGLAVTFQPLGRTCPVRPGQTLCEVAEEAGIELRAECHSGICGSDPLRVLQGQENLEPVDDQEAETLEDLCELEPGPHRLACMARITGSVVVEILGD